MSRKIPASVKQFFASVNVIVADIAKPANVPQSTVLPVINDLNGTKALSCSTAGLPDPIADAGNATHSMRIRAAALSI